MYYKIKLRFNIAEAVNFGTKKWIDLGKLAKACKCRGDSVKINMTEFVRNLKGSNEPIQDLLIQPISRKRKVNKPKDNWIKCNACNKWRKVSKGN